MRPVLKQMKLKHYIRAMYILIFLICVLGIAIAMYLQFFKEERIDIELGLTDQNSEEEDAYDELKAEFPRLFNNKIEINQKDSNEVQKLNSNYDIVVSAYTYQKVEDRCILNVNIPYININKEKVIKINEKIKEKFKNKADKYDKESSSENVIYTVSYTAYIQKNILSLVIRSEWKEGERNQKIEIFTVNYNIKEDKEISLSELMEMKNIKNNYAENKIKKEIQSKQEQIESLETALGANGNLYKRNAKSDIYKLENTKQYFLGKNEMLYLVYSYGNNEDTSEIDLVIFK